MNLIIMNFSVTARLTRQISSALPKLAVPYFLYPIHVAAIVIEGYSKQINLYHTHPTGAVTVTLFRSLLYHIFYKYLLYKLDLFVCFFGDFPVIIKLKIYL